VTLGATNVIAPMLAPTKVIALFFAGVTTEATLGNLLGGLVLERNNFGDIAAAIDVRLARAVTRFASRDLVLPTTQSGQTGVRGMLVGLELNFVAGLTGVTTDILTGSRLVVIT
jgi:hypothetical protein